jgi:hypothetical protein
VKQKRQGVNGDSGCLIKKNVRNIAVNEMINGRDLLTFESKWFNGSSIHFRREEIYKFRQQHSAHNQFPGRDITEEDQ